MLNQFSRTEILFGTKAMEKLANSRVAVFGIGGVGGYAVEALVRAGVGALDLFDGDKVCLTNLNRQIHATTKTIGQFKVDVAAERAMEINPKVKIEKQVLFYCSDNAKDVDLMGYDYIIDAIDTVACKLELIEQANKAKVPIISSMGAGNKQNAYGFEVADIFETSVCPLARVMRSELKKRGVKSLKVVYSREPAMTPANDVDFSSEVYGDDASQAFKKAPSRRQIPGSTSFVPPVAGFIMAGEVIKSLSESKA